MGLNIKNTRVEGNIRKLAELTGRSLTDAIDEAVLSELRRIDQAAKAKAPILPLIERLQPLLDDLAKNRIDWRNSKEIMDEVDRGNEP